MLTFAFRSTQLTTASRTGVKATGLRAEGRATAARAFMDTAAASGCRLVTAISAHTVFHPCTERMKPALPDTSASTCSAKPVLLLVHPKVPHLSICRVSSVRTGPHISQGAQISCSEV